MALTPDQQRRMRVRRMNLLMAYASAFKTSIPIVASSGLIWATGNNLIWDTGNNITWGNS